MSSHSVWGAGVGSAPGTGVVSAETMAGVVLIENQVERLMD